MITILVTGGTGALGRQRRLDFGGPEVLGLGEMGQAWTDLRGRRGGWCACPLRAESP